MALYKSVSSYSYYYFDGMWLFGFRQTDFSALKAYLLLFRMRTRALSGVSGRKCFDLGSRVAYRFMNIQNQVGRFTPKDSGTTCQTSHYPVCRWLALPTLVNAQFLLYDKLICCLNTVPTVEDKKYRVM